MTSQLRLLKAAFAALVLAGAALGPAAHAAPQTPPISLDRWDALKQTTLLPNGMTLGYIDLGRRDGQPVVLIHGYTDNARDWQPLVPYLAKSFRLIVVDIRGHGASSKPECCYTRVDFAYDVKLLLDKLGVQRADIVGHSLGSVITQTFAEYWPEKTRKVVLISSTAGDKKCPTPQDRARRKTGMDWHTPIRQLKDPIDPDSPFMVAWWSSPTHVDEDFLRRQRKDAAQIPMKVWLAVMDQGLAGADLQGTLPMLTEPALLIFGGKDDIIPDEGKETLKAALPKAQVKVFPNYGHNPFWEDPQGVADAINPFLTAP